MPNRYATTGELNTNTASYLVSGDPNKTKQLITLSQMTTSSEDNQMLMKMTSGEVYLSPIEQKKLWTITSPSELQEMLSSKREKLMGADFCSKKKKTDDWDRPADINSILYYNCPGDDPNISIDRENRVSRLAYDEDYAFPSSIPLGLRL